MFYKKDALKYFAKLTGKSLRQGFLLKKDKEDATLLLQLVGLQLVLYFVNLGNFLKTLISKTSVNGGFQRVTSLQVIFCTI